MRPAHCSFLRTILLKRIGYKCVPSVKSGSVASVQTGKGVGWVQESPKCVQRTARS